MNFRHGVLPLASWLFVVSVLGVSSTRGIAADTSHSASQLVAVNPPPLVRFTGKLKPAEENVSSLSAVRVTTENNEWQFALMDVATMTYTTNSDWSILNDIFPLALHFVGSAELLHRIDAAGQSGIAVSVGGRLYRSTRTFLVTSVTPVGRPA